MSTHEGSTVWCRTVVGPDGVAEGVRFVLDEEGCIRARAEGVEAIAGDAVLGLVLPGFANAHSHLFHRALRGRTHAAGGDFWAWRERMYTAAGVLDPVLYRRLAVAVFREMLAAGYTAVGEFHYVHHAPDGEPYPDHDMEIALAEAAAEAGIRLTLLDTLYLSGGIGQQLSAGQRRFGDGDAEHWLARWHALRERLSGAHPAVTLGAAIHSVRAVAPAAMATVAAGLPAGVPLHIHLSEQPLENEQCLAEYGVTPAVLLQRAGLLGARLSVVHATHLTEQDTAVLGEAGVTVVMCPTTEADLGDGIGPAHALAGQGASIALGSDQNAVVDPFLEMRGLEAGERLASRRRGRFSPSRLLVAASTAGYSSLGVAGGDLSVGAPFDAVEIDGASPRTAGAEAGQVMLAATAADVRSVHVAGTPVHRSSPSADEQIGTGLARIIGTMDAVAAGRPEKEPRWPS